MSFLKTRILLASSLVFFGAIGFAEASVNTEDVARTKAGEIIHSTNGNCVRTKWMSDGDVCADHPKVVQQEVKKTVVVKRKESQAAKLTQEERTVYFAFNHSDLLPEAREHLDTLATVIKADETVKEARIVGFADRIGSVDYNERLSQKRAETVRDYLVANGATNARVTETRWVGESEPITKCPSESRAKLIGCLHKDRRVEVEIDFLQETPPQETR